MYSPTLYEVVILPPSARLL